MAYSKLHLHAVINERHIYIFFLPTTQLFFPTVLHPSTRDEHLFSSIAQSTHSAASAALENSMRAIQYVVYMSGRICEVYDVEFQL